MSSPSISEACILPNPDIAGIGVRSSIYVQSFVTAIIFVIFELDNKITQEENHALHALTITVLLTACSLLISSFIQVATVGMSAYHAQIVLNLSWINSTSLLTAYMSELRMAEYVSAIKKPNRSSRSSRASSSSWSTFEPSNDLLKSTAVGSLHFCAMSALGLMLWIKGAKFGSQPDCNNHTIHVLFGHSIPLTNKRLKILSLIIYGIAAIPMFNAIIFNIVLMFVAGILYVVVRFTALPFDCCLGGVISEKLDIMERRVQSSFTLVVGILLNIVFIVDNEHMIRRSAALVQPGESDWTFGQTLALVLLALPGIEIYKALRVSVWGEGTHTVEKPAEMQERVPEDIEANVETA